MPPRRFQAILVNLIGTDFFGGGIIVDTELGAFSEVKLGADGIPSFGAPLLVVSP